MADGALYAPSIIRNGLLGEALALLGIEGIGVRHIDVHAHAIGVGDGGTGCWANPRTRWGLGLLCRMARPRSAGRAPSQDQRWAQLLRATADGATCVDHVVVLALDAVHDAAGRRLFDPTSLFIPNDYVFRLCGEHPKFLPGASVHPDRRDALEELHRVAERGAVLIKWLPNAQQIDPADARLTPFYRALVALGLPLLSHLGHEYSLGRSGQHLGDPRRLRRALEEGVTVIGAHCASAGLADDGRENFLHFVDVARRYPNLYGDLSALTLMNRWRYLRRILREEGLLPRLLNGTDYPLPPCGLCFAREVGARRAWSLARIPNLFERDHAIKRAMGVPGEVFARGYQVLPVARSLQRLRRSA